MFLPPRISLTALEQLCRRLAVATSAGLDDRRIWRDEARRQSGTLQRHVTAIADAVAEGRSVGEGLQAAGNYFPPLFRQLVEVGELSGRLDRTYRRLADHYQRVLQAQREFRGRLAWPLFQLGVAALVVGVLIFVMGLLPGQADGSPGVDLLGFGLAGWKGLLVYLNALLVAAFLGVAAVESIRRRAAWIQPLQDAALRLPLVGPALQTLCLARFAWALQLLLDSPIDLRKALPLALDAAGADRYRRQAATVVRSIEQRSTIGEALAKTGVFPQELLDAIEVGEQSGALVETMQRESREYEQRSAAAVGLLAQAAGYVVWLAVAGLIVALIFRIFTAAYLGPIRDALP
jgi:type II secretory pathway component PulF